MEGCNFGSALAGGLAAGWPPGGFGLRSSIHVQPWFPPVRALDAAFSEGIRVVLVVSQVGDGPQTVPRVMDLYLVDQSPWALFHSHPHIVYVCANGTIGLPQLLPSPCSASVFIHPHG